MSNPSFMIRLQRRLAQARFLTFSVILHIVIVMIGGTVVIIKRASDPPDFTAGGEGFVVSAEASAAPPPQEPVAPLPQNTPTAPSTTMNAPVSVINSINSNSTFSVAAVPMNAKGTDSIAEKVSELGKGGAGAGAMRGGGTAMKFFNVQAKADNIVFVVDVSGSMISGEKSPKTYEVLEKEVIKVIKGLTDKNGFGIVAFSKDAATYKPELVRASNEERERGVNWLKKISPEQGRDEKASQEERDFHHGTRADNGLARAFAMKPDTIFFISDGEPTGSKPPEILQEVAALQANLPNPVTIHAIAFLADGGQQFMRDLAEKNRGTFREINPKDVK